MGTEFSAPASLLTAFVTMLIMGISLWTLPVFLDKPAASRTLDRTAFWLIVTGFILRAIFAAPLHGGVPSPELLALPVALELLGAFGFLWNLLATTRTITFIDLTPGMRAYEKFVYAAYAWFFVATLGIAVITCYHASTGHAVSTALLAGYRHAQTVGFITFMLLGFSLRALPAYLPRPLYSLRLLDASFVLLMIGNTMRIVIQALNIPFGAWSFPGAGWAGWCEALGVALYGYNLLCTRYTAASRAVTFGESVEGNEQPPITETLTVARLVNAYPQTLNALFAMGFNSLSNPLLRLPFAKRVTLKQAAAINNIPVEEMLERLRHAL